MMPKMPKITNTIEIPSKTPHKLRLNFRLCSRFKLFWADHREYELVVWWPLRWLPSGGYFLEDVEWTDLFDLMEDAVVNACLGTVPPGWGTLAPPCAKLRREANDMASSLSLSSKASFLWKKKKNNNKLIKKFLTCKKINQQFRCHLKTKTLFQKFGSPLWTLQKNEKNFHSIAICQ